MVAEACETIKSLCMHPHLKFDQAVEQSRVLNPGILAPKGIHFSLEDLELGIFEKAVSGFLE